MRSDIEFNGFSYHKNVQKGNTIYYRCSRSLTENCNSRLIVKNEHITMKGSHSCTQIRSEKIQSPENFIDEFLEIKASRVNIYPNSIYTELLISLRDKFKNLPYRIPPKDKIFAKIRKLRKTQDLSSIQGVISPPACYRENGTPLFRRLWTGDIHNEYHTIMIWATNESLALLRYNSHMFIDATFRSTPQNFSQCLIIMTFDIETQTFVPCAYALMTGKLEHLYSVVLHEIIFLLEFKWMPKYITTDFELGLIKPINYECPESKVIGCYFHLKQGLRRKLIKHKIIPQNIQTILDKSELLTLVNHDDFNLSIQYIKNQLIFDNNLDKFWAYFEKTWIKKYGLTLWNIHSILNDDIFAGRTNYALERYHRRLTENFPNAHPNLAAFVEVIKIGFKFYDEWLAEVRQNRSGIRYEDSENQLNPLLIEFQNFKDNLQ